MREARIWIVVVVAAVGMTLGACGGSADECSPQYRSGFECYYGVCIPANPDAGGETAGETGTDADTPPHDDAGPVEATETLPEGGGCVSAMDCDDGVACTQDLCDPASGDCYHPTAPDDTPCEDDGDPCTQDVCLDGTCAHPVAATCCTGPADCDDANPCTDDTCEAGLCTNAWRPECCTRDADCLAPGHVWECDLETMTCYDPPGGEPCADCMTRRDCGDGGDGSDDWCVIYDWTHHGCSKDCLDDLDCPGAYRCWNESDRACAAGESGCYCVSRFGGCDAIATIGLPCEDSGACTGCTGCDAFTCNGGTCTAPCEVQQDCPWGFSCEGGLCVRGDG